MIGPLVYLLDRRDVGRRALAASARRLSPADRRRLAGFARERRRGQFLLGRALLRCAVARELGADAGPIQISRGADGRPHIDAGDAVLPRFSLSHSGDWIACAVHADVGIGVDVECMETQRDHAGIGAAAFSSDELAWLLRQPAIAPAFYRLWTGREALFKLGTELGLSAAVTATSLVAGATLSTAPAPASGWHYAEVRPGVALSLVWAGDVGPLRIERVDPARLEQSGASSARIPSKHPKD